MERVVGSVKRVVKRAVEKAMARTVERADLVRVMVRVTMARVANPRKVVV